MKVAIINPWFISDKSIGGTERFVQDLAVTLAKLGHKVDVYMLSGNSYKKNNVNYTRDFYIYIDDNKLAEQTLNNEKMNNAYDVFYEIPEEYTKGKDSVTVYIRPLRYTEEFMNAFDHFTLSFFSLDKKQAVHGICGSKSGRDINKTEACGLTPNFDEAAPYFEEAKLVLVCKKMAKSKFAPKEFIDDTVEDKWYPEKDFLYIYFAEIEKVLISE